MSTERMFNIPMSSVGSDTPDIMRVPYVRKVSITVSKATTPENKQVFVVHKHDNEWCLSHFATGIRIPVRYSVIRYLRYGPEFSSDFVACARRMLESLPPHIWARCNVSALPVLNNVGRSK